MKKYVLNHCHDYGSTCYTVQTNRDIIGEMMGCEDDFSKLIAFAVSIGIENFEPHRDESVEIFEVGEYFTEVGEYFTTV